jgi:hypothetical protein
MSILRHFIACDKLSYPQSYSHLRRTAPRKVSSACIAEPAHTNGLHVINLPVQRSVSNSAAGTGQKRTVNGELTGLRSFLRMSG